ncbi:hypothetical protein [Tianweitania sediminis]|uniref:Uncharacterized protein n=1 Tax=Tianweitania sediminis TaxID=1502156 RepID=A0A8J7RAM7_9HYPH|nr:hypothetical protein [Tianweitania sediminis]MBP0441507.1 hypothetical protein [Tianweitania sediminis]
MSPAAAAAAAHIRAGQLAGPHPRLTMAVLDHQLGRSSLDRLRRLAWDIHDTIQASRLRIRFGLAQRRLPLPEAEQPPEPSERLAARIRALRHRVNLDNRDSGYGSEPPRPR